MSKVTIYTTNYCPYCVRAKSLLKQLDVSFEEIDVTEDQATREKLVEMSGGRKTVPQIFINGKGIGGYDDLAALHKSGELDSILNA